MLLRVSLDPSVTVGGRGSGSDLGIWVSTLVLKFFSFPKKQAEGPNSLTKVVLLFRDFNFYSFKPFPFKLLWLKVVTSFHHPPPWRMGWSPPSACLDLLREGWGTRIARSSELAEHVSFADWFPVEIRCGRALRGTVGFLVRSRWEGTQRQQRVPF